MVFANIAIDGSYNVVISLYSESATTIEAGKYLVVVVGED